jgi:hypothetical protein
MSMKDFINAWLMDKIIILVMKIMKPTVLLPIIKIPMAIQWNLCLVAIPNNAPNVNLNLPKRKLKRVTFIAQKRRM